MMGRVFRYAIVLTPLAAVTTYATAFLVFRQVDISFVQFATLLCVPVLQAAVLAWRDERPADAVAALGWTVARHPLAQPVIALDALVLGAGVFAWDQHVIGFGAPVNIHSTWILVKTAAVAVFLADAVRRSSREDRLALALRISAPLLLVLALEPTTSWLAAGFARVHAVLGPRAEVLQRLAFYSPLFLLLASLTLRASRQLRSRSREAGQLLQVTVAASVVTALTVVLANFNLAILTQPWLGVATLSASAATSTMLLAAIVLATAAPARPEGR